jgi:hypothetical protein
MDRPLLFATQPAYAVPQASLCSSSGNYGRLQRLIARMLGIELPNQLATYIAAQTRIPIRSTKASHAKIIHRSPNRPRSTTNSDFDVANHRPRSTACHSYSGGYGRPEQNGKKCLAYCGYPHADRSTRSCKAPDTRDWPAPYRWQRAAVDGVAILCVSRQMPEALSPKTTAWAGHACHHAAIRRHLGALSVRVGLGAASSRTSPSDARSPATRPRRHRRTGAALPQSEHADMLYVTFSMNKRHCWLASIPVADLTM